MQSIAEQLLRQNLVTAEQAEKAEEKPKAKRSRRGGKNRNKGEAPDAKRVAAQKAIEAHRLQDDYAGEIPFPFTRRNKKRVELRVNVPTAARLGSGEYAIVESGKDEEHVIVTRDALAAIAAADPQAIRYHADA